jgi:UDP-glucose 4-epimerase
MGLTWLITGGCGFIGTSLINTLVKEGGHRIRIVDNLSVGSRNDLAAVADFTEIDANELTAKSEATCQLIVGDILDDSLAIKVTKDVDVIIHLAANTGVAPSVENPRMDCVTNIIGTLNYLEAARQNQVQRFVFASSGAPIGECTPPIHEEMVPHPVSPYGTLSFLCAEKSVISLCREICHFFVPRNLSFLCAEKSVISSRNLASAYFRTYGIETVALRFGNIYGPGSGHKNSVVAKFIKQSFNGETLEIYGDGKQTRDFIYIDDLIQAIRLAATLVGVGGEVFQIATAKETTLSELVETLVPILNEAGIENVKVHHTAPRLGDVKRNYSDTSKARQRLG